MTPKAETGEADPLAILLLSPDESGRYELDAVIKKLSPNAQKALKESILERVRTARTEGWIACRDAAAKFVELPDPFLVDGHGANKTELAMGIRALLPPTDDSAAAGTEVEG